MPGTGAVGEREGDLRQLDFKVGLVAGRSFKLLGGEEFPAILCI